jgi:tetratricopeptide (TPR) repeat protein
MRKNAIFLLYLLSVLILIPFSVQAQTLAEPEQPSVLKEDKAPTNYVYDLKLLIRKSKDNIKTVNEKIKAQAVQKRNQMREQKAREYYEQAQKLVEEGRFDDARQLYDKAIRITEHPEMKYYIKESAHRTKAQKAALSKEAADQERKTEEEEQATQQRVATSYETAVSLYKQQRFKDARDEFTTVEELSPEYKATRSYLQIIEQDIFQSEQRALKDQKKEVDHQSREAEVARMKEKELWRKEIERKEIERENQLKKQAQDVYAEAVRLYKDRKFLAAKDKFQEVDLVIPDYKSTRAYLKRVERDVAEDRARTIQDRERTQEKKRWDEKLAEKKAEEEKKKALEQREAERLAQLKEQAEFLYQSAVALFDKEQFQQSLGKFQEIEQIYPDYRFTRDYLKRIAKTLKIDLEIKPGKNVPSAVLPAAVTSGKVIPTEADLQAPEDIIAQKQELLKLKEARDQAEQVYNEAVVAYNVKDFETARIKFSQVENIYPNYKKTANFLSRIDNDIQSLDRQKKEKDVELLYNEAVALFQKEQLEEAKKKFVEVTATLPDYKQTATYLDRIDDDIIRKKEKILNDVQSSQAKAYYDQAVSLYKQSEFEQAKPLFVKIEMISPGYKDVVNYLKGIDDDIQGHKLKLAEKAKRDEAEGYYSSALTLYQAGEFETAKEKFNQADVAVPGYKETARYLASIEGDIARQKELQEHAQKAAAAEPIYVKAVDLYKAKDFVAAKKRFLEVQHDCPGFKDTEKYLSHIDEDIKLDEERIAKIERAHHADTLFADAVNLYAEGKLSEARDKFLDVQTLDPSYQGLKNYLSRIDKDIRDQRERAIKSEIGQKAEAMYTQAVDLYLRGEIQAAKVKFQQVSLILPDYKKTKYYLARADKDYEVMKAEQEKKQFASAESLYQQAVTFFEKESYGQAYLKFSEVEQVYPDYKATRKYLSFCKEELVKEGKSVSDLETPKPAVVTGTIKTTEVKEATGGDVLSVYMDAVSLYKDGKSREALAKFEEVESLSPDYRSTRKYIETIKGPLEPTPKSEELAPSAVKEPSTLVPEPSRAATTAVEEEAKAGKAALVSEPVVLTQPKKVESLYAQAVNLYKDEQYDAAEIKFREVQGIVKGYRATQKYLELIIKERAKSRAKTGTQGRIGTYTEPAVAADVQSAERAQLVAAAKPQVTEAVETVSAGHGLSARSGKIYRQIQALAAEKDVADSSRTFAKIDQIIVTIESEQKRVARQIEIQERNDALSAQRAKGMERVAVAKEKEAAERRGSLKQEEQKIAVQEAEDRDALINKERQDVTQREKEEKEKVFEQEHDTKLKAGVFYQQGLNLYREKNYADAKERFLSVEKILPGYRDTGRYLLRIEHGEGEQEIISEENKDRAEVARLAEKAGVINQEVQSLTVQKNYPVVREKFTEMENLLKEIQVIKDRMQFRRRDFERSWEEHAKAESQKAVETKSVKDTKALVEGMTRREKALVLYHDGQTFYSYGRYPEARVKFVEATAMDPSLKAAFSYVQRVDRILEKKDYEDQKINIENENRGLERDQEAQGPSAAQPEESAAVPAALGMSQKTLKVQEDRSRKVYEEGVSLYRSKRYREAHVKFEEAAQYGDPGRREKARRYLGLVETALVNQRVKAEQDRVKEEQRYLEAKRAETRLSWERDKEIRAERLRMDEQLARQQRLLTAQSRIEAKAEVEGQKGERIGAIKNEDELMNASISQNNKERTKFIQSAPDQIVKSDEQAPVNGREAAKVVSPEQERLSLKQTAEEEKKALEQQRLAIQRDFEAGVAKLYNEALDLYKKRQYPQALENFNQVNELIKGYKKTEYYIQQIDKGLTGGLSLPKMQSTPSVEESVPAVPDSRNKAVNDVLDKFEAGAVK